MTAKQFFDAGRVSEALGSLADHLRDHPLDTSARTFLFELLCFSGQYARAEKQLGVLAQGGGQAELGAVLYYSALHAEKSRHDLFREEAFPGTTAAPSGPGVLNGKAFQDLRDADPDLGPRLEVYAAGSYLWLPFAQVATLEMAAPQRLRDTLWAPGFVVTGPEFKGTELGEALLPAVYPFSWKHPDESVWLGRETAWGEDDAGRPVPAGQKMLLVDGAEFPFLEVRSLAFDARQAAAQ